MICTYQIERRIHDRDQPAELQFIALSEFGYLIRDRDGIYGVAVTHRLRAMGICDEHIAPGGLGLPADDLLGSPWQYPS